MATKTSTKKKTTRRRTKKKTSSSGVIGVFTFLSLLGIVSALSLLTPLFGDFGDWVKKLFFGLFGKGGYFVPLLLIYGAFLYGLRRKEAAGKMGKIGLLILFFSALCSAVAFTAPETPEGETAFFALTSALFTEGASSGGVLGGYLAVPLVKLLSRPGAVIVFSVLIGIPLLIFGIRLWRKFRPDESEELLPAEKKSGKKVEKELREIKKDIREIKETKAKAEKEEAAARSKPLTPEEKLNRELEEIEKPYLDAADKTDKASSSKKRQRVEKLEEPKPFSGEEASIPAEEPVAGQPESVSSDGDDLLIPLTVKPRKGNEVPSEPELNDAVQEEIFRKIREAEEKENASLSNSFAGEESEIGEEMPLPEEILPDEKEDISLPESSLPETKPAEEKPSESAVPAEPAYVRPPLSLLTYVPQATTGDSAAEMQKTAEKLIEALRSFNVETKVLDASRGPTVTRYELQPLPGVKISRITNLSDDIALHLAATGVRLEAPIPGKAAIGVEIPNKTTSTVYLEELVNSDEFRNAKSTLSVCLGKDIGGNNVVIDLAKMPHLLIAGATGSGKSVCINSIIISLLYHASPEEVRLIMVDPKVVELNVYNGIPHLLIPVVTDPRKAAGALGWAVGEMLKRYELFREKGVRDFAGYNRSLAEGETRLPQIVIIIDEMADLMMTSPTEVEDTICRLAQMARAAGMHLVVATQRPSATVITGTIKANIPSRIAFAVSSGIDSRIIIDASGAEKLIGKGDMLYDPLGATKPLRVQGCFVSDKEVEAVVGFIKQNGSVEYDQEVLNEIERKAAEQANKGRGGSEDDDEDEDDDDSMLPQAIDVVVNAGQASTSTLQRKLKLGYARAARIMDQMEERGIIGPYQGSKPREVMITRQQWLEMKNRSEGKFD